MSDDRMTGASGSRALAGAALRAVLRGRVGGLRGRLWGRAGGGGGIGRRVGRDRGLSEQLADEFLDHEGWKRSRMRQPFDCAWARSVSSGVVAIGSVNFSSSGMLWCESL